jgi:cytochrome P450
MDSIERIDNTARGRLPPGPAGSFLGGSATALKQDMLGFMRRCAEQYPDLCHYRVGPVAIYQVTAPQLIKEVLQDHADKVIKPWDLQQWRMLIGKGLLTNEGEHWRSQRRKLTPAFHHERIRRYGETMVRYTTEMLDGWRHGERRNLSEDLTGLTLRVVCKTLFGMENLADSHIVGNALEAFMRQYERLLTGLPIPMALPTPGNMRAWRAAWIARARVRTYLEQRRTEGRDGDDLLSWLLATQADTGMSDRQIIDEVVTLMGAGHETTSNALSWAMMTIAQHPEVAQRLRAEIDSVLNGRAATPEDVPKLVYTRQVINETMRLHPPAYALARTVAQPFELDGYLLPKRARIVVPIFAVHRDARWYQEPQQFQPERWTEEFDRERHKYAFFPFGGGPRFCIGSNFAMMEANLLLASIAQRFEWKLDAAHDIGVQASVTLRPRNGVIGHLIDRRNGTPDINHPEEGKAA